MKNLLLIAILLYTTYSNAQDFTKVKTVIYNFTNQNNGDNIIYDESGNLSDTVWNASLQKGNNDDTSIPGSIELTNGTKACSKAITLNGEDEWILINKKYTEGPFDYDRKTFSISLWLKPAEGSVASETVLLQSGYGSELAVRFFYGKIEYACGIRNQDGSVHERNSGSFSIDHNKIENHWILVQISFNNGTVDGFLNGSKVVSFNMSSSTLTQFIDGSGNHYNNINIGAQVGYSYALDKTLTDHSVAYLFKGSIGEIIMNLNAISSDDATQKYDAEKAITDACAGRDVKIGYGESVTLDGSGSVTPYGTLIYTWTLNNTIVSRKKTLTTDTLSMGDHIFTLEVAESENNTSATDEVKVSVLPVNAVAGNDTTIYEGDFVTLDGSKSSSHDGTMYFSWKLNNKEISDNSILKTDTLSIGSHMFVLTVSNASSESNTDTVIVDVVKVSAIAEAGKEQTIKENETLTLDAGASTGYKTISYKWTLNGNSVSNKKTLTLNDLTTGVYWFYLNITDSRGDTDYDSVKVTVYPSVIKTLLDFETLASNGKMFKDQGNLFDSIRPLGWVYNNTSTSKNSFGERLPEYMARPSLIDDGVKGKAMKFDGSSNWVLLQLPYAITKNRDNKYFALEQKNFTASVWFKAVNTAIAPPKNPDQVIFELPGIGLNLRNDTLRAAVGIFDRSAPGSDIAGTCINVRYRTVEVWTNIIIVFEGGEESSKVRVYKNGELIQEESINCSSLIPDEYAAGAIGGHYKNGVLDTYGLVSYVEEGAVDGYFEGEIDQFETFDKAFSDDDAKDLYLKYINGTSITSKPSSEISIYPNPTKGNLYVDLSNIDTPTSIKIYNLMGIMVKKIDFNSSSSLELNMTNLHNGIYIIKVLSKNKIYSSKIRLLK